MSDAVWSTTASKVGAADYINTDTAALTSLETFDSHYTTTHTHTGGSTSEQPVQCRRTPGLSSSRRHADVSRRRTSTLLHYTFRSCPAPESRRGPDRSGGVRTPLLGDSRPQRTSAVISIRGQGSSKNSRPKEIRCRSNINSSERQKLTKKSTDMEYNATSQNEM